VDRLPDFLRQVLILAYYQGLKYREIADVLDIPVGTVKSRLHRGRVALAEELGEAERGRGRHGGRAPEPYGDSQEPPAAPAPSKDRFPE
jgi:RNA polymerase sigma-70 factor (ECF subfamily)